MSAFPPERGGIQRKLLPLTMLFVVLVMQYSAAGAQSEWSGWYHCDIQDHSYTGPGTRYFCRPVSYDWLCTHINYLCNNPSGKGNSGDDGNGGSGLSVRASGSVSSFNVQRLSAASIGLPWIIDAGFIAAIDVWGKDVEGEFCLDGVGSLLFLDTSTSPRAQTWLDSVQRDGQTCAVLDRPGMLILMPAGARYRHCRIITTGHLKLRAEPSLTAEIIGYVPSGESPRLLSRNRHWFNVEYLNKAGWIGAHYTSDSHCDGTLAPAAAQLQDCGITTTGHLKLRAEPSLTAEIIGYVPSGESPRLLSRNKHWLNVEYLGVEGWIGAHYTSDSDCGETDAAMPAAAREQDSFICTRGDLRVRAGPSLEDETIGFVRRGITLPLRSRVGSWLSFEYRGQAGWIGAGYVSVSGDCT
ncbi:MAG: SH3 domain-containing protein [Chloroflexi bacterium]|nr:SH3 domain-containing protein [Chloroflexota bacterium]